MVTGWGLLTVACGCVATVRVDEPSCAAALSGVIVTDGALMLVVAAVPASAEGATELSITVAAGSEAACGRGRAARRAARAAGTA
jgi:hypothetical protein